MEGEAPGDENLILALGGMLDEYMNLDSFPNDGAREDGAGMHVSVDSSQTASGRDDGSNTGVADSSGAAATGVSASSDSAIDSSSPSPIPMGSRSRLLDGSADVFTEIIAGIVDADAVSACAGQQSIALESARRIIKDLHQSNARLGHDFPSVQRDVMKCLNLADSIRKDMEETERSIARTKEMLHIDALALQQIPMSPLPVSE